MTKTASRYRGVHRAGDAWEARIRAWGGKCRPGVHRTGIHATEAEAARAYDALARKLFGAAAVLNFPEPGA
jgi:hypothetical protein